MAYLYIDYFIFISLVVSLNIVFILIVLYMYRDMCKVTVVYICGNNRFIKPAESSSLEPSGHRQTTIKVGVYR